MNKILVTGGLGFIGSHTVDLLVKKGYEVVVLDNLERQVHRGRKPEYTNPEADYIIGDIRYKKHWLNALKGVEGIIHLAGAVGIGQSFWQTRKYIDANVGGTASLYEILTTEKSIKNKIKKIVVASSKSLYGEGAYNCPEHGTVFPEPRSEEQLSKGEWEAKCPVCGQDTSAIGVQEDKPPQNLNPYSLSKYATEKLAMDYSFALNIPTVAFRYFNAYGPRQSLSNPYTGVLAIFLSRLKNSNQPKLFEDGKQLRDYIHVKDLARFNVEALKKGNGAYNLGSGTPTSLIDIVKHLESNLGTDIGPKISLEFRPGDNRHDFADLTRFNADFGNSHFISLSEGIKDLVKWSENEKAVDMFEREEKERKEYLSRK